MSGDMIMITAKYMQFFAIHVQIISLVFYYKMNLLNAT